MSNHKIESGIGEHISKTLKKAKILAIELDKNVEFDFNGIACVVNEGTNREHLLRDYNNAHLMKWETVGPECYETYPIDVVNLIAAKTAQQEVEAQKREAEYQAEQAKRLADFEAETVGIEMKYSDKDAFDKGHKINQEGYGNAIFVYATQWAKLMQARMKDGLKVKDVAKKASHDADTVGLSGYQFGAAVGILSQTWEYGKELEAWHKLPYQQK